MPKFRKKPLVIEAVRVEEALLLEMGHIEDLPKWLKDAYDQKTVWFVDTHIQIHTLEGSMRAEMDDWIICGVQGELYPCKPDIFEATYEAVE